MTSLMTTMQYCDVRYKFHNFIFCVCKYTLKVMYPCHKETCLFSLVGAGGDGDWSIQTCREEAHGFQSGHQDGQVSPVSEGGREGREGEEGSLGYPHPPICMWVRVP